MKKKYDRLSRDEKKECRSMYYGTTKGREMQLRLFRLLIIGILGLLFGIYILGNGILMHTIQWYEYCVAIPLLIFSVIFLIGSYLIRKKVLNQFALKIPKFKNK